jgi:hypothetical protein
MYHEQRRDKQRTQSTGNKSRCGKDVAPTAFPEPEVARGYLSPNQTQPDHTLQDIAPKLLRFLTERDAYSFHLFGLF